MTDLPLSRFIDYVPEGWCRTVISIRDQKNYVRAYNFIECYEYMNLGGWSNGLWRSYRSAWCIIFKRPEDALKFKFMGF